MRPKLYRRYELLAEIRKDPRASIRELCDVMGIRAPSQVHSLLRKLEEEGVIVREPRLARSIQIGGERRAKTEMKARHVALTIRNKKRQTEPVQPKAKKQTPDQLEAAIERVVQEARARENAGVDVLNDFRRSMRGAIKAVKVG